MPLIEFITSPFESELDEDVFTVTPFFVGSPLRASHEFSRVTPKSGLMTFPFCSN